MRESILPESKGGRACKGGSPIKKPKVSNEKERLCYQRQRSCMRPC